MENFWHSLLDTLLHQMLSNELKYLNFEMGKRSTDKRWHNKELFHSCKSAFKEDMITKVIKFAKRVADKMLMRTIFNTKDLHKILHETCKFRYRFEGFEVPGGLVKCIDIYHRRLKPEHFKNKK